MKKVKDIFLNEDELLPFKQMVAGFKLMKDKSGSFQAINFLTRQMSKIDGVHSMYLEKGRTYSDVYYNPATKTAFLFLMAINQTKYKKSKSVCIFSIYS